MVQSESKRDWAESRLVLFVGCEQLGYQGRSVRSGYQPPVAPGPSLVVPTEWPR
jgi:hypothetical protein